MKQGVITLVCTWVSICLGSARLCCAEPANAGVTLTPAGLVAKGTKAETPWYVIDSGKPGPTVFISGGVHGDEAAGAAAATGILKWQVTKGKLIVLPRANVVALAAHKRNTPGLSTNLS